MANDISTKVAAAKNTLSRVNRDFPSPKAPAAPAPAAPSAPAPKKDTTDLGAELAAKRANVEQYEANAPKMHNGGPVVADGAYRLKAGEHVLTAAEADKARQHALMAAGMKSLTKSGKKTTNVPGAQNKSKKKIAHGITVRPE